MTTNFNCFFHSTLFLAANKKTCLMLSSFFSFVLNLSLKFLVDYWILLKKSNRVTFLNMITNLHCFFTPMSHSLFGSRQENLPDASLFFLFCPEFVAEISCRLLSAKTASFCYCCVNFNISHCNPWPSLNFLKWLSFGNREKMTG